MKRLMKLTYWVAGSLLLSVLFLSTALAQETSPIKLSLVVAKASFEPNEFIKVQVSAFNDSGQEQVLRLGVPRLDYYLMIKFIGPDGPIRNSVLGGVLEPTKKSFIYEERRVTPAEKVAPDWDNTTVMQDARAYYELREPGRYIAQLCVPLEIWKSYFTDPDTGALLAYTDDPDAQRYNPVCSNEVAFEILPPEVQGDASVRVRVSHFKIGGGSTPGATRTDLMGVEVHLIPRSSLEGYFPLNWKDYSDIWKDFSAIWWSGIVPAWEGFTDRYGKVEFSNVPQGDYLILAHHPTLSQDFKHMGCPVAADDPNWLTGEPIEKHLMVMEKVDGKKVPGKTTRRKGSDLLITEPVYVEWDSTQELYPFVFETIGDWSVTTSVIPPEGFVADYESLGAELSSETEAVQFTITDVGSKWEETEVIFDINHKGKKEKIKSKIGVKLSKKLAKVKGTGVYGDTPDAGPYKGGKKVKKEKDKD